MAQNRIRRSFVIRLVAVAFLLSAALGTVRTAKIAQAASAPTYSHSYYITNPSTSGMQALGQAAATWSDQHCPTTGTYELLILDFGQITIDNTTYEAYDRGGYFVSFSTIQNLALTFANTWFNDTTNCPRLYFGIGVNNYHECPGYTQPPNCNVYTAGEDWAAIATDVLTTLQTQNEAWQIQPWGASDMEAGWDTFSCSNSPGCVNGYAWQQTQYFINGYNYYDSQVGTHTNLADFGDAAYGSLDLQGNSWTAGNVYTAAWGAQYDVPVPEIYYPGDAEDWAAVINSGSPGLTFEGPMTECTGGDPLPTGNCWVAGGGPNGTGDYENSPTEAWNNLYSDFGQQAPYTTNIQNQ